MGLVTMPDRRTVLRAILLGSAGIAVPSGLAALGGCGVPTGGRPEVDGPGPSAGIAGLTGGGTPDGPDTAISPEDLVAKSSRGGVVADRRRGLPERGLLGVEACGQVELSGGVHARHRTATWRGRRRWRPDLAKLGGWFSSPSSSLRC